jgi:Rrf2 family protein
VIRISTRGRYALRALVDLALYAGEGPVARQDIAARQGISADYVAQLFRALHDAGLVESAKGPGGGYRLGCDAAEITALDVVQAVEGPIALVHCVEPEDDPPCGRADYCVTRPLWKRLSDTISECLHSVTLQELRDEASRLAPPHPSNTGRGVEGEPSCT